MHYWAWLKDVLHDGWMKALPSIQAHDICKLCKHRFTHIWFDTLNKDTYALCISCRHEWMFYNRKCITRRERDK